MRAASIATRAEGSILVIVELFRIEAVLAHQRLDDVRDEAAGMRADGEPLEAFERGDVGTGVEREDRERRFLVDDRHDFHGRAAGAGDHQAGHIDEAEMRHLAFDVLNCRGRALGRDHRDVEPFFLVEALLDRHEQRRMPAEDDEVEREGDVGRLLGLGRAAGHRPGRRARARPSTRRLLPASTCRSPLRLRSVVVPA